MTFKMSWAFKARLSPSLHTKWAPSQSYSRQFHRRLRRPRFSVAVMRDLCIESFLLHARPAPA
jgi:hypothetical protein